MNITFIGLGVMGYPMAGHLANAGHTICVFNRTSSKANDWVTEFGGMACSTPKQAVLNADVVCICVGNDDDVRSVIYSDHGVLAGISENAIIIDHTTTSALLAKELHTACKQHNVKFLDAPVSGGQVGAQNGKLTIMLGGDKNTYDLVSNVLNCYSQKHQLIGEVGSGQLTKMVNQICIAGVVQGLSEAIRFAQNADLDVASVIDVISKGAAQSWQMENRWQTMDHNQFDFGFAVDWMRKDLNIVLDEAKRNNSKLPVTEMVDQFYAQVQSQGGNRFDTSSLITLLPIQNIKMP